MREIGISPRFSRDKFVPLQTKQRYSTRDISSEVFLTLFFRGFVPFLSLADFVSRDKNLQVADLQRLKSCFEELVTATTKKGRSGTNRINYTGEFTLRLKPSYSQFNIMNSQEQMDVYRELEKSGYLNMSDTYRASNSGVYGKMYHLLNDIDPVTGKFALENTPEARASYLQAAEYRNTDWFDVLFNNSISQNHAVSMSSGTDREIGRAHV